MKNVRLCIGAAARRPGRFSGAESLLEGQAPDKALFLRAGQAVSEDRKRFWPKPAFGNPAAASCRYRRSLRPGFWKTPWGGYRYETGIYIK